MRWEKLSIGTSFVLPLLLLGCNSMKPLHATEAVALTAKVDFKLGDKENPYLEVEIRNMATKPIAVSETFGYGAYNWIGVRLRDSSGDVVPYPADVDLFHTPPHQCMAPGEIISMTLNLQDWNLLYGGRVVDEDHYGFGLAPGAYEVQVLYTASPEAGKRRCVPLTGIVRSAWQSFRLE